MLNEYLEMKRKHQQEIDAFPIGFAFNNKQFKDMMKLIPLGKDEKYISLGGGSYLRESDYISFDKIMTSHRQELMEEIKKDKTGEGFICSMFLYELENHEYAYSYELDATLNAIGLSEEEIKALPNLNNGLNLAINKCLNK